MTQIMAQQEFEKTLDRLAKLSIQRQLVGKPSLKEVGNMQRLFPGIKSATSSLILENKDMILDNFSQRKTKFSIPGFCATFLLETIRDQFLDQAEKNIGENRTESFRCFHDLAIGLGLVANGIIGAESALSNLGEESISRVLAYQRENYDVSALREAEAYFLMKGLDQEALKLLIKDKTGFLLADDIFNKIRSNSLIKDLGVNDGVSNEYVTAGAGLARDLYKKLYKVIESSQTNKQ
jgi:hypothetical protein